MLITTLINKAVNVIFLTIRCACQTAGLELASFKQCGEPSVIPGERHSPTIPAFLESSETRNPERPSLSGTASHRKPGPVHDARFLDSGSSHPSSRNDEKGGPSSRDGITSNLSPCPSPKREGEPKLQLLRGTSGPGDAELWALQETLWVTRQPYFHGTLAAA